MLMQYYGYLRRKVDDLPDKDFSGFDFWLNKLNQFNGDYRAAEMVNRTGIGADPGHRIAN